MKRNSRGFTLAELLIVVAIVGVLVAIAIPIFTSQLEKSRESTDLANARGLYAEIMSAAITEDKGSAFYQSDGTYQGIYTPLAQKQDDWQMGTDNLAIGGVPASAWVGKPGAGGSCTITYNPNTAENNGVTISWDGSSGSGDSGDDSGGGSGDDSGGTQPADPAAAADQNKQHAGNIGRAVLALMHSDGVVLHGNGAHVTIVIYKNGTISISVDKTTDTFNADTIRAELVQKGYIINGTVDYNTADTAGSHEITVHRNGNDGGQIKVDNKQI